MCVPKVIHHTLDKKSFDWEIQQYVKKGVLNNWVSQELCS
jgi:hypothetical protein